MAYDSIPDGWRVVGKAVKQELVERIHDNLEDLDSRLTNVEGAVSTTLVANQSITKERDNVPLGTIVWSPLSESQFNAEVNDGEWELCDGSDVTGSDYATLMSRTTVPDIRGRFIRMKAHGTTTTINPDGDVATDTAQADEIMTHGHSNTFALGSATVASSTHRHSISHAHQWLHNSNASVGGASTSAWFAQSALDASVTSIGTGSDNIGAGYAVTLIGSAFPFLSFIDENKNYHTTGVLDGPSGIGSSALSGTANATTTVTLSGSVTNRTGPETRPKNITENAFIKINRNYVTARTGYLLWRAPQDLTINQVILTPVTQGTSGTLTVDIKKGPLGSISTSIFTALPDMAYNYATAQTGTINPTNAEILAGEYVRFDITTTQAKLQEFHILIGATPG